MNPKITMAASQLSILLHYFWCTTKPWPWQDDATTYDMALRFFWDNGLMTARTTDLTDRGKFYIRMLLATPFPVSANHWVDPREVK